MLINEELHALANSKNSPTDYVKGFMLWTARRFGRDLRAIMMVLRSLNCLTNDEVDNGFKMDKTGLIAITRVGRAMSHE